MKDLSLVYLMVEQTSIQKYKADAGVMHLVHDPSLYL